MFADRVDPSLVASSIRSLPLAVLQERSITVGLLPGRTLEILLFGNFSRSSGV